MGDLTFGRTFHDYYDGSTYELSGLGAGASKILKDTFSWDKDRARACLCDGGWTGLKCDMRVCPHGNDIMDNIPSPEIPQKQTITLYDANEDNSNFNGKTFALQFTTKLNQTFTTQPIAWNANDMLFADEIRGALIHLPNKVIDDVSVVVDQTSGAAGVLIEIEFTGDFVQGPQQKLEVLTEKCDKGCNPLITGLENLRSWHVTDLSTVKITTSGSHESFECGNRGKCNHVTGICECYNGFGKNMNICVPFIFNVIHFIEHFLFLDSWRGLQYFLHRCIKRGDDSSLLL
jgi:EGF-like domain.